MKYLLFISLFLLLFCGCTDKTVQENNDAIADGDADWYASQVDYGIVYANTAFALDLLQKLVDVENGNIFFSPLSLSTVLSMTLNGAAGNTLSQMQDVLHFNNYTLEELNEQSQYLIRSLSEVDPNIDLGLANSIWIRQYFPVKEDFISVNEEYYYSQIFPDQPFDNNTVNDINEWASAQTNDRIPELIDYIDAADQLFLINAIYFDADWTFSFNPEETIEDFFYTSEGECVETPIMRCGGVDFTYLWEEDFSAVRMPYGSGDLAMYIFLPDYDINLKDWLLSLETDEFNGLFSNYEPLPDSLEDGIIFEIPSFEVSFSENYKEMLIDLGMLDAFCSAADFSEMAYISDDLHISRVKQDAWIKVNEEGSEAAAAALVPITSGIIEYGFSARVPFLYIIRDDRDGILLFAGIINDPSD